MQAAVGHLKSGKAQGHDHIAPEFISNCGKLMLKWLREFFLSMHVWSQTSKSLETSGHYRRPETEQVCR